MYHNTVFSFSIVDKRRTIATISLKNASIVTVLQDLAKKGNLNLILTEDIVGNITFDLQNLTPLEAIKAINEQ